MVWETIEVCTCHCWEKGKVSLGWFLNFDMPQAVKEACLHS